MVLPEVITQWWTDPTKRRAAIRYGIFLVGVLIKGGGITIPDWVYQLVNEPGFMVAGAGLLIPAGQMNKGK